MQQVALRPLKFWIPVIVSIPLTAICVYISLTTGDTGFDTYIATIIFFPYAMLSTLIFGVIPIPAVIASLCQIPVYGMIIGAAWTRGQVLKSVIVLLLIHSVAVGLGFRFIVYASRQKPEGTLVIIDKK